MEVSGSIQSISVKLPHATIPFHDELLNWRFGFGFGSKQKMKLLIYIFPRCILGAQLTELIFEESIVSPVCTILLKKKRIMIGMVLITLSMAAFSTMQNTFFFARRAWQFSRLIKKNEVVK